MEKILTNLNLEYFEDKKSAINRNFTSGEFLSIFKNSKIIDIFSKFFNDGKYFGLLEEDSASVKFAIKDKENGFPWFVYKLRDRRFDGPGWQPTPLTNWHYNSQEDLFPYGSAVEQSRYFGDPESSVFKYFSQEEAMFIINPFEKIPFDNPTYENLKEWIAIWSKLINNPNTPFPGQFSIIQIPKMSQVLFDSVLKFLKNKYDYLTSIPTWLHVAISNSQRGFKYFDINDEKQIQKIISRLPQQTLHQRKIASWIVLLQFWAELAEKNGVSPESLAEKELILRDDNGRILTYPLTPKKNLWQYYQV